MPPLCLLHNICNEGKGDGEVNTAQPRESSSLAAQTVKNLLQCGRPGFDPWVGKIPWKTAWQPTPAFLPGEAHGQRSLAGSSSWDCKELDVTV